MRIVVALLGVLVVLVVAGPTSAQVKYVDEAGVTHYAQSEWMVPERYRAKAKRPGPLPFVSVSGPMQGGLPGGSSPAGGPSGPSRIELQDAENARNMREAAEKSLAQRRDDEAKKAEFNRCVGEKRSSPCF